MKIVFHGHSMFEISCFLSKQESVNLVIDPFSEKIGLKPPKLKADILLISHDHYDHNNSQIITGDYFLISEPGEYEIKNVNIKAIKSFHDQKQGKERGDNLIFKIEAENIHLCHMGDFGQKELTNDQLTSMGKVDILFLPVGGIYTISAKEAKMVVEQLEPKIIIPMHYYLLNLKIKLESLEKFLDQMGKKVEKMEKLQIKSKDLQEEGQKIVVLEPI